MQCIWSKSSGSFGGLSITVWQAPCAFPQRSRCTEPLSLQHSCTVQRNYGYSITSKWLVLYRLCQWIHHFANDTVPSELWVDPVLCGCKRPLKDVIWNSNFDRLPPHRTGSTHNSLGTDQQNGVLSQTCCEKWSKVAKTRKRCFQWTQFYSP